MFDGQPTAHDRREPEVAADGQIERAGRQCPQQADRDDRGDRITDIDDRIAVVY
jgi:hypothetical protein